VAARIVEYPVQYNFGTYPLAVHVLAMYKRGYQVPAHWHQELEFVTPISGSATVYLDGKPYVLQHNLGVLINANRIHALSAPKGTDTRLLIIQLQPDLLLNGAAPGLAVRLSDTADDFLLLDSQSAWQDTVLKQLSRLGNYHRFGGMDALTAYMESLAITARCLPHFQLHGDGHGGEQVQFMQMCSYIEENYQNEVPIAAIARSGGVGRSRCFEIFAACADQTPNEYVQFCRLRHAKHLLMALNLDVSEVARRCGFKSASYFSMQFKRQNGVTPRDYRRSVRTISN